MVSNKLPMHKSTDHLKSPSANPRFATAAPFTTSKYIATRTCQLPDEHNRQTHMKPNLYKGARREATHTSKQDPRSSSVYLAGVAKMVASKMALIASQRLAWKAACSI